MAAHSVGDDEQALIRQHEEVVLVVVALHPHVSEALDLESHWSRRARRGVKQLEILRSKV
jgi:hypothetical protein